MKFSYSKVQEYCNELETILARIKSIEDNYSNQIAKIRGGSVWSGQASEGFAKKGAKTVKMLNTLETSLQNSISYVKTCSNNYAELESAIMNATKKM